MPRSPVARSNQTVPEFSIPPDYAGQTITIDIYDPGDISGGGNVDLYILDPANNVVRPTAPATVFVADVGTSESNSPGTQIVPPLAE